MPKRKRTEAARKGWKKRNSSDGKTPIKRRKQWDDDSMVEAMDVVKSGRLGVNRAADEYDVPRTTLKDRLAGRVEHGTKSGIENIPKTRPVLLLLDGHSSHFTPEAIKVAAENEIVLFCLPPNATHIAQPLDVSFFGPLKKHWYNVCHTFMTDNPGKVVTKFHFCSLLNGYAGQFLMPMR